MLLLHGIFGTGANLRTVARKLADRQPGWGFVLPDLRAHGGSLGLPGPQTFAQCAVDVVRLEASLGHPVHGIAGHSFGGKVALARLGLGAPHLERAILLDSAPGADPERMIRDQAGQILALLERVAQPIASRESFLEAITSAGHSRSIAEWLAMQVRRAAPPREESYELRLDLPVIRSMLEGYFSTDCWGVLETPPSPTHVLFVAGGRSTVVRPTDLERLRGIATATAGTGELARETGSLQVAVLERAGHWLHVDDPEGLIDVVAPHLS